MRKRILSVVLTVLMLAAMVPSAMAATLEEINLHRHDAQTGRHAQRR